MPRRLGWGLVAVSGPGICGQLCAAHALAAPGPVGASLACVESSLAPLSVIDGQMGPLPPAHARRRGGESGETGGEKRRIDLEAASTAGWRAWLGRGLLSSLPVAVRRNAHSLGRPTGRPGAS